ncbi:MAG: hypothetical protein QM691_17645 [Opitutaceae bacterium]
MILSEKDRSRAYDHLRRAEHFLAQRPLTEADLADCLANLRRALTQRVQLLEKLYGLRGPLEAGAKRPFVELLAEIGVVRPTFLKALLDARNDIEYRDRKPPPQKRCQELADALWYFLRSTDHIALQLRSDFQLTPTNKGFVEETYWLHFDIRYGSRFRLKANGWIPASLVSRSPRENWLEMQVAGFHTKKERWSQSPDHGDKADDDLWVIGLTTKSRELWVALLKLAFDAV